MVAIYTISMLWAMMSYCAKLTGEDVSRYLDENWISAFKKSLVLSPKSDIKLTRLKLRPHRNNVEGVYRRMSSFRQSWIKLNMFTLSVYQMMRYGMFSMRWASASRGSVSGSWDCCNKALKVKKVKVGFFYSATYSGNAATSRAVQS